MQNKTIKSLSLALAILLGSATGFSMHHEAEEMCKQKPVWGVKVTSDLTTVFHHDVNITVSKCGKIIDVSGKSACLGFNEKKYSVQGLELALIMKGLDHQLTPCHVEGLITEYEKCPCPEAKSVVTEEAFKPVKLQPVVIGKGGINPANELFKPLEEHKQEEIRAHDLKDLTAQLLGSDSDEDFAPIKKAKRKGKKGGNKK